MCWSTFGSILILWDLITIPLGIFDLPQFVQTLSILARASFVYWLLDMPLHFFFGVEVAGTMELRPRALARTRGSLGDGFTRLTGANRQGLRVWTQYKKNGVVQEPVPVKVPVSFFCGGYLTCFVTFSRRLAVLINRHVQFASFLAMFDACR
ncbi:unnamed protein product [Effrenium voratum]|nr:unnamed protein product [Effrenium voratum]